MDRFHYFLVTLLKLTHAVDDFDREAYKELIHDICETYGISKGVAEFYLNNTQEKLGNGEVYCGIKSHGDLGTVGSFSSI